MIDIHSHILPGIDDGSKCMADSLEILRQAQKHGIKSIIFTPHYIDGTKYNISNKKKENILKQVKLEAQKEGIDINLYLGNEFYFDLSILSFLEKNKVQTLAKSRYLLFELPFHQEVNGLKEFIFSLTSHGYVPILAHPERYEFVKDNPQKLVELLDMGVLLQSNVGSFLGQYGADAKRIVNILAKHKMIHFLGSDVHHPERQNYGYYQEVEHILSKEYFERISKDNPQKIIDNKEIEVDAYIPLKKTLFGNWK